MRVVYVSSFPPAECGIATYTQYLSDAVGTRENEVFIMSQVGGQGRNVQPIYWKEGIYIRKPAENYVEMITHMSTQNPDVLSHPFDSVLRMAAIMEYDFDNGQNPDDLARKVLGPEAYEINRQRLGGL